MAPYDLVIIGAGAAGSEAAFTAARRAGRRILLAEAAQFGGTCTNQGCVPTKVLVRAAKIAHQARTAGGFGIRVGPPEVDWGEVIGRARRVRDHMLRFGASPFIEAGIEVRRPARAVLTGEQAVAIDGEDLTARAVLLATGLRAAMPPVPGLAEAGPLDNEGALELRQLPRRMAVIGSGPIGCEFAQIFSRLGVRVTLLEMADRILPPEEPEAGAAIGAVFAEEGIETHLGIELEGVERTAAGRRIRLRNGRELEVDEILVATGRTLDGAALGLDQAGIEWTPKGIQVDDHLRTSVPWAWAAGDVVGGALFTHVASELGQVAARNALDGGQQRTDLRVLPRVTFTDPEVASVGLTEARARESGRQVKVGLAELSGAEKAQIDGQTHGHVKLVADADGQLLGCSIVAETAGDMIHEAVAMMAGRVPLGTIAGALHAYPTLSELMRSAAASAG